MTTTEIPTETVKTNVNKEAIEGSASDELARVVLAQGEIRLQAQLQIALAADQRAMVLAGICAATATAFLGAAVVAFGQETPQRALGMAALGIVIVFGVAGGLAAYVARPAKFWLAGGRPKNWWEGGVLDKPLSASLVTESLNYDERIEKNDRLLSRNAKLLAIALRLACIAPLLGAFLAWALNPA